MNNTARISEQTIQEAVRRLVEVGRPQRIILFGSYARGDARHQSDLDFLVIQQEVKSWRKETVRLQDALRSMRIPVDVLLASEATFRKWADTPGTVIYRARKEGQLRYEAA